MEDTHPDSFLITCGECRDIPFFHNFRVP